MSEKAETVETEKKDALSELSTDELIGIIKETRNEAKQRRLKEKELQDRLDSIESEKNKAEQDKKIAEGKKDEVILDLTKQLDEIKKKASQWDEYNTTKRGQLKDQLKDNWLDSFDLLPLSELEILASKFNKGTALADTDNGLNKKKQPGKIEGLKKDLETAIQRKDLIGQMQIKRMIEEEEKKK